MNHASPIQDRRAGVVLRGQLLHSPIVYARDEPGARDATPIRVLARARYVVRFISQLRALFAAIRLALIPGSTTLTTAVVSVRKAASKAEVDYGSFVAATKSLILPVNHFFQVLLISRGWDNQT
jgi:hypothetical protein